MGSKLLHLTLKYLARVTLRRWTRWPLAALVFQHTHSSWQYSENTQTTCCILLDAAVAYRCISLPFPSLTPNVLNQQNRNHPVFIVCKNDPIYYKKQIMTGWKKVLLYTWDFHSCFIPCFGTFLSHEDRDGCWVQLFKKFSFPLSSWQEISGLLTWTVFGEQPTECIFGSMNAIREEKIQIADCGRKHLRVLDA